MKRTKPPLCKCGCRKEVNWNKWIKRWSIYLPGHFHRDKIVSEETKKKMSIKATKRGFFKEYNKTEEHRLKVVKSNKNREVTEETKKKISNTLKGFKHTEGTKNKLKMNNRHLNGKDSPNWKGGIHPYSTAFDVLSPEIKKRDCHKCIYCESNKKLRTHHIDFDKKNSHPNNLVTLCLSCHTSVHPRKNFLKGASKRKNRMKGIKINKKIILYMKTLPIKKDKNDNK